MALDDTSAKDLGNGGGQELTKVSELAASFVAAWAKIEDSEDEDIWEIAYEAWDALQAKESICSSDVLAKLAAFRFRFGADIGQDALCDRDFGHLDNLVKEASAFLASA